MKFHIFHIQILRIFFGYKFLSEFMADILRVTMLSIYNLDNAKEIRRVDGWINGRWIGNIFENSNIYNLIWLPDWKEQLAVKMHIYIYIFLFHFHKKSQ